MEIYANSPRSERTVFLPFPALASAFTAHIYREDELLHEVRQVLVVNNADGDTIGYSTVLPLFLTQYDSNLEVRWTITYSEDEDYIKEPEPQDPEPQIVTVTKKTHVQVITPILSKEEILDIWDTATPAEVTMIEKAVRHIINAYTGQEFGQFIGTRTVSGTGSNTLFLPQRLLELQKFNGIVPTVGSYVIGADGHTLRYAPWGVPPVKADAYGLHMHTGGVIHNPNMVRVERFASSAGFRVTGRWGWEDVPAAVKEAAKLLVNDYACADSQYRDRYLTSMTAADWRIQFNSGAYQRTGNVRADQLLSDYVVTRGWGII